MIELWK